MKLYKQYNNTVFETSKKRVVIKYTNIPGTRTFYDLVKLSKGKTPVFAGRVYSIWNTIWYFLFQ